MILLGHHDELGLNDKHTLVVVGAAKKTLRPPIAPVVPQCADSMGVTVKHQRATREKSATDFIFKYLDIPV